MCVYVYVFAYVYAYQNEYAYVYVYVHVSMRGEHLYACMYAYRVLGFTVGRLGFGVQAGV